VKLLALTLPAVIAAAVLALPAPHDVAPPTPVPAPLPGQILQGEARLGADGLLELAGHRIGLLGALLPRAERNCAGDAKSVFCNDPAARAVNERIAGARIECIVHAGPAGQPLGRCSLGDGDLNAMLVVAGSALADPRTSTDYVQLGQQAADMWKQAGL